MERATAEALHGMMGVDLTAIPTIGVNTALTIASEIGPDFSVFPSAQHFCSWLGLAPGTRVSVGKPLPGRAPKVVNKVAQSLRMAAMTARRSQTFIGAGHHARLARKDAPIAITATARELASLIYTLITRGEEYVERGTESYEQRRVNDDSRDALREWESLLKYFVKNGTPDCPNGSRTRARISRRSTGWPTAIALFLYVFQCLMASG